jgi:hypothetical protein
MPELASVNRVGIQDIESDMSGSEKPEFSDALAVGRALDLTLPDSRAVRDAFARAQAESLPWLFKLWHGLRLGHMNIYWPCVGWIILNGAVFAGAILYG